jgi:hypothetical protein
MCTRSGGPRPESQGKPLLWPFFWPFFWPFLWLFLWLFLWPSLGV